MLNSEEFRKRLLKQPLSRPQLARISHALRYWYMRGMLVAAAQYDESAKYLRTKKVPLWKQDPSVDKTVIMEVYSTRPKNLPPSDDDEETGYVRGWYT